MKKRTFNSFPSLDGSELISQLKPKARFFRDTVKFLQKRLKKKATLKQNLKMNTSRKLNNGLKTFN